VRVKAAQALSLTAVSEIPQNGVFLFANFFFLRLWLQKEKVD